MNDTIIKWTEKTWNPVSGCTPISPGCAHCYARTIADNKRGTRAFPVGFDIQFRPHKLAEPRRLKAGELVFVNSMSDLFHEGIPDDYRHRIMTAIRDSPATFQTLTKRPARAAEYFAGRPVPRNLWLGVTVEDQRRAEERIPLLQSIAAPVRFLSVEPLLEQLDLGELLDGIGWVIVGGESGNHLFDPKVAAARGLVQYDRATRRWVPQPEKVPWVRSIRDAVTGRGVPFFFKQWGGNIGHVAGNTLDGLTHEEYPRARQDQAALAL